MPKYEDVIDLYDDNGKRIAKDIPLEAISPLRNNAIKKIVSLTKRTCAVSLAGIEKALKTGSMTGGGVIIKGKEIDIPLVKNADKIAELVKEKVQVYDGDGTVSQVKTDGKNIVVIVPEERMNAGIEYTTGFTAVANSLCQPCKRRFRSHDIIGDIQPLRAYAAACKISAYHYSVAHAL